MSEEQNNFKVTDRRLFNPDGSPREVEREEEGTDVVAAPVVDETRTEAATATSAAAAPEVAAARDSVTGTSETGATSAEPDTLDVGLEGALPDVPGVDDPASFVNFLMSIASNAAASLGMMEHPVTGERGVDLQLAKHWIDVLGMLQQKTRGNLHPQEQRIIEEFLADLRMQYVSLTTPSASPKRGFSGRDITGGK